MAEYALTSAPYHGLNTHYKRATLLPVVITFVDGVPSIDTARSAPGFTIAGDTGQYTGTAPKGERGVFWAQAMSATDFFVVVDSYAPKTGVFEVHAHDAAGNHFDVPTGDELWLFFHIEGG